MSPPPKVNSTTSPDFLTKWTSVGLTFAVTFSFPRRKEALLGMTGLWKCFLFKSNSSFCHSVFKGQTTKPTSLNPCPLESFKDFQMNKKKNWLKRLFLITLLCRTDLAEWPLASSSNDVLSVLRVTFSPGVDDSNGLRWSFSLNSECKSEKACQCWVWCRRGRVQISVTCTLLHCLTH